MLSSDMAFGKKDALPRNFLARLLHYKSLKAVYKKNLKFIGCVHDTHYAVYWEMVRYSLKAAK